MGGIDNTAPLSRENMRDLQQKAESVVRRLSSGALSLGTEHGQPIALPLEPYELDPDYVWTVIPPYPQSFPAILRRGQILTLWFDRNMPSAFWEAFSCVYDSGFCGGEAYAPQLQGVIEYISPYMPEIVYGGVAGGWLALVQVSGIHNKVIATPIEGSDRTDWNGIVGIFNEQGTYRIAPVETSCVQIISFYYDSEDAEYYYQCTINPHYIRGRGHPHYTEPGTVYDEQEKQLYELFLETSSGFYAPFYNETPKPISFHVVPSGTIVSWDNNTKILTLRHVQLWFSNEGLLRRVQFGGASSIDFSDPDTPPVGSTVPEPEGPEPGDPGYIEPDDPVDPEPDEPWPPQVEPPDSPPDDYECGEVVATADGSLWINQCGDRWRLVEDTMWYCAGEMVGSPAVCPPADAYSCMKGSELSEGWCVAEDGYAIFLTEGGCALDCGQFACYYTEDPYNYSCYKVGEQPQGYTMFGGAVDTMGECACDLWWCLEDDQGARDCYNPAQGYELPDGWSQISGPYATENECSAACAEAECPTDCSACSEWLHSTSFNSWCSCSAGGYEWQQSGTDCVWDHVTVCGNCVISDTIYCETLTADQGPFEAGDDVWAFPVVHMFDGGATYMKEASDCPAGTYTKVSGAAGAPNSVTLSTGQL